jgi:thiosulfate reductase cytochrome b subunit
MQILNKLNKYKKISSTFLLIGLSIFLLVNVQSASADSINHPTFPLLDQSGENVLDTGEPVSTIKTCGECHDTGFIEQHSFHAQAGFSELSPAGETKSERAWDTSSGIFGRWNPITYRYLSPNEDELVDLTPSDWVQTIGLRHTGGGPASDFGVEMNCFLCHFSDPNNDSRIEVLKKGEFEWANTATLNGTGIVTRNGNEWNWNLDSFHEDGHLKSEFITIEDPSSENCGGCHGVILSDGELITENIFDPLSWSTLTTGQINSPQKISNSGLNISDKAELSHAWDIHSERLLECTDCHYSLNNPIYAEGNGEDSLSHLVYDPRKLDFSEYLLKPIHDFASGESAQAPLNSKFKNTMRRCDSCHSIEDNHTWLPYKEKHVEAINCETCHIPNINAPALQQNDWTVINIDGTAQNTFRGIDGNSQTVNDLITGYTPVLLQRKNIDGDLKLMPYNLVTSWFWVYGEPQRPVRLEDLKVAWLDGNNYQADILDLFDENQNGLLDDSELRIDSDEKSELIESHLVELGLDNPQIISEIQPYNINHNVVDSRGATKECQACHGEESRITQPFKLASYIPGDVYPEFVKDSNSINSGVLFKNDNGSLYFQPEIKDGNLYIIGHDSVSWVDWFGAISFFGTVMGVVVHGGLRVVAAKKNPVTTVHKTKKVYMYSFYERLWHWLQTFAILMLTFTGLIIHKPTMFGIFSFSGVVQIHNTLAFILVANAVLALFYNLVSGDIQRFMPQPQGFFNQAFEQVIFYTKGIFNNDAHPFEKSKEKRLNPLQKVTYLGILNVFLPLQMITGILMWGAQRWPDIALKTGGLPFLAPFHTLVAWLFSAFIVAHVYLTTTGHTPLAGIQSMIDGWDEIEIHENISEEE